jgi:glyoxylase-like metal-dependent hydrolase (beta-lactamase superfamily II)
MKLSPSCYAVTGLGYSTPWFVNAGLIAGDEITLVVDTGANAAAAASLHGYAVAIKPANRLLVVNTEKHFDHIGGNCFFQERGIEIWGHAKLRRTGEEFSSEVQEFNDSIGNPVRRARHEAQAFFHGTKLTLPDHTVDQEQSWDLGGCRVEILLTPGHTETNLSVWVPQERVLFSGDCLIHEYLPNLEAGTAEDWCTWLCSLDRIESLRPMTVVPGHGPVAQGQQIAPMLAWVRQTLQEALAVGYAPTVNKTVA